ncbi:AAC(3) family N-acetyltransferase [Campylobacter hepaticus]|uniref:Aminoglycoside N(3)-acetyltransferase n=1 Tax=Campylobacter hepaticus TaxID=1813019 RepID=A0A6I1PSD8_9BACT|nr:AAC(3) family N-acetyltransferase [Campylobacter hepaticus]AXP08243.1 aminoglycoside N(3)-acetyltransferase [Campylobacter hepaticus]MCZ0772064.1 AAC(3) family N-acetyltransferase [Campylobacter hepaticus]MCZ0773533.1 AAC(3) family N-acetyltransferase [Campylobacter hepaticus]MCZ0774783.1 AAC(3) family N-acetyltransferase [Campylobacter hepaticus]MPV53481.1 acetyltransferase [Campylobacter hepaticus]
MKYFLEHNDKKYSDKDLIDAFYQLGIKRGDILCVHTELFNFGIPLLSRNEFLQTILNCFFEVIGQEGTLIMPTFTYAFCKNGIYDKINSKSEVGILTEYFRKQEGVKRSNDPIFSFAIKGAKEDLFLKDTKTCFGENCVYDTLYKQNGKLILFGTHLLGYTFTHFIEELVKVPYRYFKNFSGILINEDKIKYEKSIDFYVRNLNINSNVDIYKQIHLLKQDNNFQVENFANSCIVSINVKQYFQSTFKALKENPYCLL